MFMYEYGMQVLGSRDALRLMRKHRVLATLAIEMAPAVTFLMDVVRPELYSLRFWIAVYPHIPRFLQQSLPLRAQSLLF